MKRFNVAEANDSFEEMLETSALEAVAIESDGSDIAVLLSIEEYNRLLAEHSRKDLIKTLHDESLQFHDRVYEGLAKQPE